MDGGGRCVCVQCCVSYPTEGRKYRSATFYGEVWSRYLYGTIASVSATVEEEDSLSALEGSLAGSLLARQVKYRTNIDLMRPPP